MHRKKAQENTESKITTVAIKELKGDWEAHPLQSGRVLMVNTTARLLKIWDLFESKQSEPQKQLKQFSEKLQDDLTSFAPDEKLFPQGRSEYKPLAHDLRFKIMQCYSLTDFRICCHFSAKTFICQGNQLTFLYDGESNLRVCHYLEDPSLDRHLHRERDSCFAKLPQGYYLQKMARQKGEGENTLFQVFMMPHLIPKDEIEVIVHETVFGNAGCLARIVVSYLPETIESCYGKSISHQLMKLLKQIVPDELKKEFQFSINFGGDIFVFVNWDNTCFTEILDGTHIKYRSDKQQHWQNDRKSVVIDCNLPLLIDWFEKQNPADLKKQMLVRYCQLKKTAISLLLVHSQKLKQTEFMSEETQDKLKLITPAYVEGITQFAALQACYEFLQKTRAEVESNRKLKEEVDANEALQPAYRVY